MEESMEMRMGRMESQVGDIRHELYGNGQPGLISDVRDYLARQKEREDLREKQDKKTRDRLNIVIGLITVVIGMLTFAAPIILSWFHHVERVLK